MIEVLVCFACLTGKGCTEAASAYNASHPELAALVERQKALIDETTGPLMTQYVLPAAGVVSGYKAVIKLNKFFSLGAGKNESSLNFAAQF